MLYIFLVCLQWLFLSMYHYTTNVHYSRLRPLFGFGYFFIVVFMWFLPQPAIILGREINLIFVKTSAVNILLGSLPLVLGLYFALRGVFTLGLGRTSMIRNGELICRGIYRVVRHPQYFGVMMLHIGFSLVFGSLYNMLYSPIMFFAMYLKAVIEEDYLKRVFGRRYEECFRGVPRFVPRIMLWS